MPNTLWIVRPQRMGDTEEDIDLFPGLLARAVQRLQAGF
jgi:hypothetical protein